MSPLVLYHVVREQALFYFGFPLSYFARQVYTYREHMESDMRDEDLVFWTGCGARKRGFFVAEVDGKPVGTVAYQNKVQGSTF